MRATVAFTVLALAVLTCGPVSADVDVQIVGSYGGAHGGGGAGGGGGYGGGDDGGYDSSEEVGYGGDGYGGDGYGGDGYGGDGYGGHGHGKFADVEIFIKLRDLLIQAATNAVGFSQLAALNEFNAEVSEFPYHFPGKLSMYVRELEKVPPYYKFDYMHKKPSHGSEHGYDTK